MWPDSNAKAGGIDSGKVTSVPDVEGAQSSGSPVSSSNAQIEYIRVCARRFGIE